MDSLAPLQADSACESTLTLPIVVVLWRRVWVRDYRKLPKLAPSAKDPPHMFRGKKGVNIYVRCE